MSPKFFLDLRAICVTVYFEKIFVPEMYFYFWIAENFYLVNKWKFCSSERKQSYLGEWLCWNVQILWQQNCRNWKPFGENREKKIGLSECVVSAFYVTMLQSSPQISIFTNSVKWKNFLNCSETCCNCKFISKLTILKLFYFFATVTHKNKTHSKFLESAFYQIFWKTNMVEFLTRLQSVGNLIAHQSKNVETGS